jgi:nucleotide-binding universal stress UspA family protein
MLVALDLNHEGDIVFQTAIDYARRMGAVIDLLHVEPPDPSDFVSYSAGPDSVRDSVAKHLQDAHSAVIALRAKAEQSGVAIRHAMTLRGDVFAAVTNKVDELKPDLLVMGQGHHRRFFLSLGRSPTELAVADIKCVMMIVPTG